MAVESWWCIVVASVSRAAHRGGGSPVALHRGRSRGASLWQSCVVHGGGKIVVAKQQIVVSVS